MRRLAKPMLFFAALVWGASFMFMKDVGEHIPTFFLLAIRFTAGTVLLGLFCWKRWKSCTWDCVWRGSLMGLVLFTAFTVQTFGLMGTTPSKNAFLTTVYCVVVPFLNWAVMKARPDRYNLLAAVLCVGGVGFVSLQGTLTITWGDGLTLIAAFFYAAHIITVEKVSGGKDIYLLTTFQFASAALLEWIFGFAFQEFPSWSVFDTGVILQLLYLGVLATTVCLLFQNVGQYWSDPASASIILSLESVFGVMFSVAFYGDPITLPLLLGFLLIFVAVICSETKFSFLRRTKV